MLNLKKWFRSMIALALVPPNKVEDGFEILLDKQPDYPSVQEFCDYFMDY